MRTFNRKIMSKPEISDEEIRQLMDFPQLVVKQNGVIARRAALTKVIKIVSLAAVVTASVAVYYYINSRPAPSVTIPDGKKAIQHSEIKKAPEVKETIPPKPREAKPAVTEVKTEKVPSALGSKKAAQDSVATQPVYNEAQPVDGFPALYDYLNREIKYPAEAIKDSIQGVETVSFIINKNGKPERLQILNSLGAPFDKEAIRLIEQMPAWKAATINDKPVSSKISLPLSFHLKSSK